MIARCDDGKPVELEYVPNEHHIKKTLYDALPRGKHLDYALEMSNLKHNEQGQINTTLVINLLVNSGNPDMYVECNKIPDSEDLFSWKSENEGIETLIISSEELEMKQMYFPCRKLYIHIVAKTCTAYALELFTRDGVDSLYPIQLGITEQGYVKCGEIIQYLLALEKKLSLELTVSLTAQHGNPDLFLLFCENPNTCLVRESDILTYLAEGQHTAEPGSKLQLYSGQVGNDVIVFNHSQSRCAGSNSIYCHYIVAVFSNKETNAKDSKIQYKLVVNQKAATIRL